MARGVCGRDEAGKEEHLRVASSSRGGRYLSFAEAPSKRASAGAQQGRSFRIGEATLRQTEVPEPETWGVEGEDTEITMYRSQEPGDDFQLIAFPHAERKSERL